MTALTLIRHGETDWNRDRRIQGSTDIPLNDTGRAQARAAGALLRDQVSPGAPLVVVSSDLQRAAETADIIAEALHAPTPRRYAGLRERAYGEAEGLEVTEFARRWGDWHSAEVPGAEPWPQLRQRALRTLSAVVQDARLGTAPAPPQLIVVSHGALIRELIRHASAGELPPRGMRLANGSAHRILFERERVTLLSTTAAA